MVEWADGYRIGPAGGAVGEQCDQMVVTLSCVGCRGASLDPTPTCPPKTPLRAERTASDRPEICWLSELPEAMSIQCGMVP